VTPLVIPDFLAHLERHGEYPVPFIVLRVPGQKVDFRIIDSERVVECHKEKLCGICGRRLGEFSNFIGGDGCRRTHLFIDPAMHRECAEWSAEACPFLSGERVQYSEREIPEKIGELFVAKRPGHVPETNYIFKVRTKAIEMVLTADGGIALKADLWLGVTAIIRKGNP
jgi:hypothetical protein